MSSFRARTSVLAAGRATLTLAGEIDLANADRVVELGVEDCLTEPGVATLVIDLGDVTFMDSTALSALIRLRDVALEAGQELILAEVSSRIQRLLKMTGLASVFGDGDDPQSTLKVD